MKLPSFTASEVQKAQHDATDWDAVMQASGRTLGSPPKGAFTAEQYAQKTGANIASVHGMLQRRKHLFDSGLFVDPTGKGGCRATRFYWLKTSKLEGCRKSGKTGSRSVSRSRNLGKG